MSRKTVILIFFIIEATIISLSCYRFSDFFDRFLFWSLLRVELFLLFFVWSSRFPLLLEVACICFANRRFSAFRLRRSGLGVSKGCRAAFRAEIGFFLALLDSGVRFLAARFGGGIGGGCGIGW